MANIFEKLRAAQGPFNSRLVELMRTHELTTLDQLADRLGVGRSTLHNMAFGRATPAGRAARPSLEVLLRLAEALRVPVHTLIYELEPLAYGHDMVLDSAVDPEVRLVKVLVAGWVGAGPDQFREDGENLWVDARAVGQRRVLGFRIQGDSMDAGRLPIRNGDIVLVDLDDKGSHGQPIIARLSNDGYVCKLLKADRHDHALYSANIPHTNGTPTMIPLSEVAEVVGRVYHIVHTTD
jgi:repressor LexA